MPAFLLAALRIRLRMLGSPGLVGISLIAQPLRKTFDTLSAWQDRGALDQAVVQEPHMASMSRFRPKMASSVFTFWKLPAGGSARPEWLDARRRLELTASGSDPAVSILSN